MFSNNSNLLINGGTFNHFDSNNSDKWLEILYSKVSSGALYNSGERFDPPKCHPNTRTAILDDLVDWLNHSLSSTRRNQEEPADELNEHSLYSPSSAWLNGAAGAGKSAIAQTFAQMCHDKGQLSSTFFFSRTSDTGRNDERRLVATLAYQMAKHIPETQPYITAAILNDPLIFDLSLESQVDALMVTPLSQASKSLSALAPPKIIVLDGLDECLNPDIQRTIVKVFVAALGRMQHNLPHKLLIASRPESHLVSVFSERHLSSILKHLSLDETWEPDKDIRLFLVESFANIRKYHPLSEHLPSHWPSDSYIDTLIRRSSGQFIYASTVIKYLKSERHHPVERLKIIQGLSKDTKNRPYAQLDALYSHIFSSVEDPDTVLRILRIFLMKSVNPPCFLRDPLAAAQIVLGLPAGLVKLNLNDLSALVSITYSGHRADVKFLHASLPEYLMDETRSGKFYVNSEDICVDLAKRCLKTSPEKRLGGGSKANHSHICFAGPVHFAHQLLTRRSEIYQAISDFDLEAALSAVPDSGNLSYITEFLVWILSEYRHACSSDDLSLLLKFVNRLRHWLFIQLQKFPFNNAAGLDLTVFAMSPLLGRMTAKGVLNPLADIFQETLEKNRVSIPYKLDGEIGLCWNMMPALSAFFEDAEFAEAHTMTPRRYGDAALHCFRHLLRESQPRKWENDERWSIPRSNYLQAMRYATFFLSKAEAQKELDAICREMAGFHDDTDKTQEPFSLREDAQGRLYTEAYSYLEKLINQFEQKTGGAENPWRCDIMIGSGFAMSIVEYICRVRDYMSDSIFELNGREPSSSNGILRASSHTNQDDDPYPLPTDPMPNPMGLQRWPLNFTTMRWYSWYEQNVLRWIKPDNSSIFE